MFGLHLIFQIEKSEVELRYIAVPISKGKQNKTKLCFTKTVIFMASLIRHKEVTLWSADGDSRSPVLLSAQMAGCLVSCRLTPVLIEQ